MEIAIIKYYKNGNCISQFPGDAETIANSFFHLNFYSLIPEGFSITKRTAENREFLLCFIKGGYCWKEIYLETPSKLKEQTQNG